MTEKERFTVIDDWILDNFTDTLLHIEITDKGARLNQLQVCDLLNQLNDENVWLKKQLKGINSQYLQLEEENKRLNRVIEQCKEFMEMLDDLCVPYLLNDGLEELFE